MISCLCLLNNESLNFQFLKGFISRIVLRLNFINPLVSVGLSFDCKNLEYKIKCIELN